MPAPLPYYAHHIGDWAGSATVREMSYAARGIYRELLDLQWSNGHIPNETERLANILRCSPDEWAQFAPFVDHVFPAGDDGLRRNPRMAADRIAALARVETNRTNGARGGRPKQTDGFESANRNETERLIERKPKRNRTVNRTKTETKPNANPKENQNKNSNPNGLHIHGETDFEREFGEFYARYPKQAGDTKKAPARKKFETIRKSGIPFERIIAGVERYARYATATGIENTRFVKNCEAFLNQSSFDEPWDLPTERKPGLSVQPGGVFERAARLAAEASSG